MLLLPKPCSRVSLNSRTLGTLEAAPAKPSIPEPELRLLYN